jgi:two-component system NarL family response regulator
MVREGLALIIDLQRDMKVVGVASTGEAGVELFASLRPDVTLMDLEMPGMSGVEATRAITEQFPAARIIVVTVHHGNEDIYRALQAGATTYVLKDMLTKDLIRVIRQVDAGARPMPGDVAAILAERQAQAALTSREIEVLDLVAAGLANKEIASTLTISLQTVNAHVRNILGKLDVNDRTAAVGVALRRGIIHIR